MVLLDDGSMAQELFMKQVYIFEFTLMRRVTQMCVIEDLKFLY